MNIRYITDSKGSKTAVVIPIKEWDKYNKNLDSMQQMLKMKHSLKAGYTEISQAKNRKKKLSKFKDLLDEL